MDQSGFPVQADKSPEQPASNTQVAGDDERSKMRSAPRVALMIRTAKLITMQGEFACVVRDVSQTGMRIQLFHTAPDENDMALQMSNGESYELQRVRVDGKELGLTFKGPIDFERLQSNFSDRPKRALRFEVSFPVTIITAKERYEGLVENFSQQGAKLLSTRPLALDQPLYLIGNQEARSFFEVRCKVRWRRDESIGVVFDDTFSLSDFARICVLLQSPRLASD